MTSGHFFLHHYCICIYIYIYIKYYTSKKWSSRWRENREWKLYRGRWSAFLLKGSPSLRAGVVVVVFNSKDRSDDDLYGYSRIPRSTLLRSRNPHRNYFDDVCLFFFLLLLTFLPLTYVGSKKRREKRFPPLRPAETKKKFNFIIQ